MMVIVPKPETARKPTESRTLRKLSEMSDRIK